MSELTLYYTRGFPGSGKSTLAKKMVKEYPGTLVRVNRDDIRAEQPGWKRGVFDKEIEKKAVAVRDGRMREALEKKISCINDDTNLSETHARHWAAMAKKYGAKLVCLDFIDPDSPNFVPIDKCIKQDLMRDASVGKDVILKMYYNTVIDKVEKIDPAILEHLPEAFIFDIDGTLAHYDNLRSPYQENYEVDRCDTAVAFLLRSLKASGTKVIILSGREGSQVGMQQTLNWLEKHNLQYDEFYMRAAGDRRKDTIVKKELYEQKLKFRYNIVGVFDDRKSVCRMWEEQGLTVLRCGPEFDFDIVK